MAIPLEAMTIAGLPDATSSIDCCGDATVVIRVVANALTPWRGRHHVGVELVGPVRVELQRARRHRAVDVDRQHRNAPRVFEPLQPVEHLLDAPDRERRDDQLAAALGGVVDDAGQPPAVVVGFVQSIAVGRLDEQDVGGVDRRRIGQHGPAVTAEVAAEQDRSPVDT